MELRFWLERWQQQLIGFHQEDINPYLQKYWLRPQQADSPSQAVLVPLCGKSKDMIWLRDQGLEVIGVEVSPIAVESFFAENGLDPTQHQLGEFKVYQVEGITLYCGDFFKLDPKFFKHVAYVFDRGSLVALPPELRTQYASFLSDYLEIGASCLLVAMEYEQSEMEGPPFSITVSELAQLYGGRFDIECLGEYDIYEENQMFRERGLSQLYEKVYLLTKKR
ncbi:MAG: thiopurine S-methyltransferase [Gammaproteobacteria bacterium]|nr:thiopurine S-methyltransferase [Gammaproteobacteria bacterium]MDH5692698.1 thiopurine S-methyltransferase [Gammaproteobacteria bacterium]